MADSHQATSGPGENDHDAHGHDDHGGTKKYMMIFAALCVLTTASFMTYFDFWRENIGVRAGWALMMAVSMAKASLVMLFFMHLKYEANWKYVLTIPATIMAVFLTLALIPDVGNRYDEILGGRAPALQQQKFMPDADSDEDSADEVTASSGTH